MPEIDPDRPSVITVDIALIRADARITDVAARQESPIRCRNPIVRDPRTAVTAFVIGQMEIHSRDWMADYFARTSAVVTPYKGEFRVRGGSPMRMEGDSPLPDAAFILKFPDRDDAEAFWNSDEFQSLAVLRRSGSTLNAILVDALE